MSKKSLVCLTVTLPMGVAVRLKTSQRKGRVPAPFNLLDLGEFVLHKEEHSLESTEPIVLTLELEPSVVPELAKALAAITKEAESP